MKRRVLPVLLGYLFISLKFINYYYDYYFVRSGRGEERNKERKRERKGKGREREKKKKRRCLEY